MQRLVKFALCALVCLTVAGCSPEYLPTVDAVDMFSQSVVRLEIRAGQADEWKFGGTAWIVAPECIVSARHCFDFPAGTEYSIRVWENGQFSCDRFMVEYHCKSATRDLAFATVPGLLRPPLRLSPFFPRRTEFVWGLGCHWYGGLFYLPGRVIGFVPDAVNSKGDFITDQHVSNGCSGSPVFEKVDGEWRVVGVVVGLSQCNGVVFPQGWIEPAAELLGFLTEIGADFQL